MNSYKNSAIIMGLLFIIVTAASILSSVFLGSTFNAPIFEGGKKELALRWIFVAGFILAVGSLFSIFLFNYDIVIFEIAIIAIYCPVLIISGILLAIIFRRNVNSN